VRLPDGAASRALLIGTGAYDSLPGVPEIRANVRELQEALVRHTGLPLEHCRTLLDPPDLTAVGREVEGVTKAATDLLLIYYSGHGLVASDGLLHLALPQTTQALLPWSGIPFRHLHHAIQVSRAKTKVLILDCCFSGRATQLLGGEDGTILGQITANGTFTLASSPANEPSFAFDGKGRTAFTGALLNLLEHGSPRAGATLTLGDIHLELLHHALDNHLPEPQKLGTHTAEHLPLAKNRQFAAVAEEHDMEDEIPFGELRPAEPAEGTRAGGDPLMTATDVLAAKFKPVRLTAGYNEKEVDDFLDHVALALAEPLGAPQRMRAEEVRGMLFNTTHGQEGYDMDEVDAFLDRVELELERRQALSEGDGRAA
jgi:DivIVA domain-containing protein